MFPKRTNQTNSLHRAHFLCVSVELCSDHGLQKKHLCAGYGLGGCCRQRGALSPVVQASFVRGDERLLT